MAERTISPSEYPSHDFYKTGDPDVPDCITDGHGDVVLALCRRCGLGEAQLTGQTICRPKLNWGENPFQGLGKVGQLHTNDNPLWQGPCGEGWNGGITQSMIVRFLSCRERFRLRYVLGLEPPDRWHHTWGYGNMWHVCEEAYAELGETFFEFTYLDEYVAKLCMQYPYQQEELIKWYMVCRTQFPVYTQYWQDHPDVQGRTPLLQEQVFDVPYTLPSGRVVRLRGKWDSVDLIEEDCKHCNGVGNYSAGEDDAEFIDCHVCNGSGKTSGIYLQENKTKGDIDRSQVERQLKFDLQTMMYLVALRYNKNGNALPALNYKYLDSDVHGVRYNVVRRPLSGGKGNIRPHQRKGNTPAETDEHFFGRLRDDYLAKEPDYWFFRVRAEISQEDVDVFRRTCLDPLLETICDWYHFTCAGNKHQPGRGSPGEWINYRTPFGVYSALEEGGATEYDHYLETGSESTLRRVTELFTELKG